MDSPARMHKQHVGRRDHAHLLLMLRPGATDLAHHSVGATKALLRRPKHVQLRGGPRKQTLLLTRNGEAQNPQHLIRRWRRLVLANAAPLGRALQEPEETIHVRDYALTSARVVQGAKTTIL